MNSSPEFPRYLTHVGEGKDRRSYFETMQGAANLLASGCVPVVVDDLVLENDFSLRNITQKEKDTMNRIIDEIGDSK